MVKDLGGKDTGRVDARRWPGTDSYKSLMRIRSDKFFMYSALQGVRQAINGTYRIKDLCER